MISSEVQRTLVKSAPELWAELSDPATLARHLGELGEIRVTRVEPEQKVEWETHDGDTSGAVSIESSGWGTKVKLTVTRSTDGSEVETESPADEPSAIVVPESEPEPEPTFTPQPHATAEPEPATAHTDFQTSEPLDEHAAFPVEDDAATDIHGQAEHYEPQLDAEIEPPEPMDSHAFGPIAEPEPRRGFFARLFGRFRVEGSTAPEPSAPGDPQDDAIEDNEIDAFSGVEPSEPEPFAAPVLHRPPDPHEAWAAWASPPPPEHMPAPPEHMPPPPEHMPAPIEPAAESNIPAESNDSTEIVDGEEEATDEIEAVLSGVLDRLGAAHHRPFSRA